MKPRIETFLGKKIIGQGMSMSLSDNKTIELWRNFMPRRKEIRNSIGSELYSIQIYNDWYFNNFNPSTVFQKFAGIEVSDFDVVPNSMETITIPQGLYAVFFYKGNASTASATFQYIFGTWLPSSDYLLDQRAHFEILGEKYKKDDPNSEEELWIPIKLKK